MFEVQPYAGGTNSCFRNQSLRWWYIPTLEVQPYAGVTDAADPYSMLATAKDKSWCSQWHSCGGYKCDQQVTW